MSIDDALACDAMCRIRMEHGPLDMPVTITATRTSFLRVLSQAVSKTMGVFDDQCANTMFRACKNSPNSKDFSATVSRINTAFALNRSWSATKGHSSARAKAMLFSGPAADSKHPSQSNPVRSGAITRCSTPRRKPMPGAPSLWQTSQQDSRCRPVTLS